MAIPVFHCRELAPSLTFYTDVLGCTVAWTDGEAPPMIASVKWRDHEIFLSQHSGDGVSGSCCYIPVPEVNDVFAELVARGFVPPVGDEVHNHPTDQTWGMREFYIRDRDQNCVRFASDLPK